MNKTENKKRKEKEIKLPWQSFKKKKNKLQ